MVELYLSYPPNTMLEDDEVSLPSEYGDYMIMKKMGWDWWTYLKQPDHIIYMISKFISAENVASSKRAKHGK